MPCLNLSVLYVCCILPPLRKYVVRTSIKILQYCTALISSLFERNNFCRAPVPKYGDGTVHLRTCTYPLVCLRFDVEKSTNQSGSFARVLLQKGDVSQSSVYTFSKQSQQETVGAEEIKTVSKKSK